jgi:hypothetical protein
LWSFEFGDGDRAVQRHDRRAGDVLEPLVEERDLLPVAWMLEVEDGDRCLDDVGPAPVEGERALELLPAFVDLVLVPERAVLVVEKDELDEEPLELSDELLDALLSGASTAQEIAGPAL